MLRQTFILLLTTIVVLIPVPVHGNIIDFDGGSTGGADLEVTSVDMSGGYVLADGSILAGTEANGALYATANVSVFRVWAHVDSALGMVSLAGGSVDQGLDLIMNSTSGNFINSPFGSDGPPPPAFMGFPGFESLLWDTFVTMGGSTDATTPGGFFIMNAGGILGGLEGNVSGQFVGWNITPHLGAGVVSDGIGGWRVMLAQLVVPAGEAVGGWIRVQGGGDDLYFHFGIPAPGTLVLFGLVGLFRTRLRST